MTTEQSIAEKYILQADQRALELARDIDPPVGPYTKSPSYVVGYVAFAWIKALEQAVVEAYAAGYADGRREALIESID